MMKNNTIVFFVGVALLLTGVAVTGNDVLLGALIGYLTGFAYTQWFYRDTLQSTELDMRSAVIRMRRSFFARMGFVTLVVVTIARFKTSWLFPLAAGLAAGVILSFVVIVLQVSVERGDKRSA